MLKLFFRDSEWMMVKKLFSRGNWVKVNHGEWVLKADRNHSVHKSMYDGSYSTRFKGMQLHSYPRLAFRICLAYNIQKWLKKDHNTSSRIAEVYIQKG